MGEHVQGIIMYTHTGYMSAQLQNPAQPPFQSKDMKGGTNDELAKVGRNYFTYTGPYYLDESDEEPVLLHHMTHSSFPNWMGSTQRRLMEFTAEGEHRYLTLGPERAVEVMGEVWLTRLVRRKLPDNFAKRLS